MDAWACQVVVRTRNASARVAVVEPASAEGAVDRLPPSGPWDWAENRSSHNDRRHGAAVAVAYIRTSLPKHLEEAYADAVADNSSLRHRPVASARHGLIVEFHHCLLVHGNDGQSDHCCCFWEEQGVALSKES